MTYEIQFARLTNFGKLPDRFLNCQHLRSPDIAKASMGEIFSLVEILSPWHQSAQIGQMIVNNFIAEYYQDGSTSDLVNFEASLKRVNENLAKITENGETEWIGNLNGILAAVVDDNILVAPTGKIEAYLFRDGKVNHLTEGAAENVEIHPLKTFSNVISGQLKSRDKILIANRSLFDYLALESVRQIVTLNAPSTAGLQIVKLLKKSKAKNVNLVIIGLLDKEESAGQTIKEKTENVFYLDKSTDSYLGMASGLWRTILAPLGKIITKKIFGGLGAAWQRLRRQRKPDAARPAGSDRFQKEFLGEDSREAGILKDEEIKYSPDLYVHYYKEQKKRQQENKFKKIFQVIWGIIANLASWFVSLYRQKEKRKYFYIIVAAVLILIIIALITLRGRGSVGNLESQKILDSAIASQKEAKGFLSSGNIDKAKAGYLASIENAEKIAKNPLVAKDAAAVIATSYQELDKLTSTTRFNESKPVITLSDKGKGVYIVSGEAIIATETDIYKSSLLGGKPQKIAGLPKNKGNFLDGAILNNLLYIYTTDQNLFELNPSSGKIAPATMSENGRWETANSIAGYGSALYFLDGVVGQIYKHSSTDESFGAGEEYSASKNSLKQSVSMAIDGSIYVLKASGEVIKFARGKLQDFTLKNIPTPWEKIAGPRKIYTDSDTPSLYILDSAEKRILEFDKDGVFIRQYGLPSSFQNISDFVVSTKSKKIWVLDDTNLHEFSI